VASSPPTRPISPPPSNRRLRFPPLRQELFPPRCTVAIALRLRPFHPDPFPVPGSGFPSRSFPPSPLPFYMKSITPYSGFPEPIFHALDTMDVPPPPQHAQFCHPVAPLFSPFLLCDHPPPSVTVCGVIAPDAPDLAFQSVGRLRVSPLQQEPFPPRCTVAIALRLRPFHPDPFPVPGSGFPPLPLYMKTITPTHFPGSSDTNPTFNLLAVALPVAHSISSVLASRKFSQWRAPFGIPSGRA
jgi:hypothetical protein